VKAVRRSQFGEVSFKFAEQLNEIGTLKKKGKRGYFRIIRAGFLNGSLFLKGTAPLFGAHAVLSYSP